MAKVPKIAEVYNRLSMVHERYRQTNGRQTHGRQHIANEFTLTKHLLNSNISSTGTRKYQTFSSTLLLIIKFHKRVLVLLPSHLLLGEQAEA